MAAALLEAAELDAALAASRELAARSLTRRTVREVAPPTYDGTDVAFTDFIEEFLRVADFNDWDDRSRAFHLWSCVTGNAKIKVRTLPSNAEFSIMLARFTEIFSSDRALEGYRDQWSTIRRKANQDLDTYGHLVLDLSRKANPLAPASEQDRFARDKFMDTAGCDDLLFWLRACKPNTLEKAIDTAVQWEAAATARRAVKPTTDSSMPSQVLALACANTGASSSYVPETSKPNYDLSQRELTEVVHNLAKDMVSIRQYISGDRSSSLHRAKRLQGQRGGGRGRGGAPGQAKGACYRCGQQGHLKRDCPNQHRTPQQKSDKTEPSEAPLNS